MAQKRISHFPLNEKFSGHVPNYVNYSALLGLFCLKYSILFFCFSCSPLFHELFIVFLLVKRLLNFFPLTILPLLFYFICLNSLELFVSFFFVSFAWTLCFFLLLNYFTLFFCLNHLPLFFCLTNCLINFAWTTSLYSYSWTAPLFLFDWTACVFFVFLEQLSYLLLGLTARLFFTAHLFFTWTAYLFSFARNASFSFFMVPSDWNSCS